MAKTGLLMTWLNCLHLASCLTYIYCKMPNFIIIIITNLSPFCFQSRANFEEYIMKRVFDASANKTYIGSVLFRTSAYSGAKQASRIPFWFRDLSRQNHPIPFFRPGHRPIFYNGV